MEYTLQRSTVDPDFFEVLQGSLVVEEIKVLFIVRKIPKSFSSLEEVRIWICEIEEKLVKNYAYRLLAIRSYSKAVLLKKFKEKKFSLFVSEKVLSELERIGYLSDDVFLKQLISSKMRQGYGPRYIEMKLKEQGLCCAMVREMMDEETQKMAVRKMALKCKGSAEKRLQFLLRRGFDYHVIINSVKL